MIHQKRLRNIVITLGILFVGLGYVVGQNAAAPKKVDPRKALVDQLSKQDPGYEAFMEHLEAARLALVPEQYVLSTQVYYQLANHYDDNLEEHLQALRAAAPKWNYSSSPYFVANADELKALEYAVLARMAFIVNDMDAFENNIKEAFWRGSPHLSVLFIKWLEDLRNHGPQALAAKPTTKHIKLDSVPLDVEMEFTHGGKTTLAQLSNGKKAILLDFWAPWCGPCMSLMPSLMKKAEILESQGIVVAAAATDDRGKAEKIRRDKDIKMPWLMETDSQLYSKLFDIKSIPRMVLISQEGEVLFNGHPQDKGLQKALSSLGVTL